jgi:hypothetical protein
MCRTYTFLICSALTSHLALPCFSVIVSSSSNTCATDIFVNEDWPLPEPALAGRLEVLSKPAVVGDPKFVPDKEGEYVPLFPPRLSPPPPPVSPWEEELAVAVFATCDNGVTVLDRGDVMFEPAGTDCDFRAPAWKDVKGEAGWCWLAEEKARSEVARGGNRRLGCPQANCEVDCRRPWEPLSDLEASEDCLFAEEEGLSKLIGSDHGLDGDWSICGGFMGPPGRKLDWMGKKSLGEQ